MGAVVARDGETLGEGWHEEYGGLHAEVNAIEACGLADLTGATLYVSLEPCCHEGKTPPCTGAILQSGIRRVVVGSDDPTEKASRRGLGILRDEGVEVVLAGGELAASARLLNQAFRKHRRLRGRQRLVSVCQRIFHPPGSDLSESSGGAASPGCFCISADGSRDWRGRFCI